MPFWRRRKQNNELSPIAREILRLEAERQERKRGNALAKSSLTGEELLVAALVGNDELLLTGGRKRIAEFKTEKSLAEKYQSVVWVHICVSKRATNISMVPLIVVDPDTQEQIDHPFQKVLNQPSPDLNRLELLERTVINLDTAGKVLWELRRNRAEEIVGLHVHEGWRLKPIPTEQGADTEIARYDVETDEKDLHGKPKVISFDTDEAVYFRYFNPLKPHDGVSPITAMRLHIEADLYATSWNKTFFEEETEPRGVLETDKDLLEEEAEWVRAQFEKKHKGLLKAHKIAVLPKGIKYKNTTISHTDMDFLDQQRNVRSIVASIYGVPLPVIGMYESETASGRSAGVEQYMERFWTQTLIPLMQRLILGLNESLGNQFDPPINFAFDLDSVEALQKNQKDQAETAKEMVGTGLTWNEIRQKAYNEAPLPGMDWVPAPVNLIPVGMSTPTAVAEASYLSPKKKLLGSLNTGTHSSPKLLTGRTSF